MNRAPAPRLMDWLRSEPRTLRRVPRRLQWVARFGIAVSVPIFAGVPFMSRAMDRLLGANWESMNTAHMETWMRALLGGAAFAAGAAAQGLYRRNPVGVGLAAGAGLVALFSLYCCFIPMSIPFWLGMSALSLAGATAAGLLVRAIRGPAPAAVTAGPCIAHLLLLLGAIGFFAIML
jgi:hypothetical protein